jgi:hypothetical protein
LPVGFQPNRCPEAGRPYFRIQFRRDHPVPALVGLEVILAGLAWAGLEAFLAGLAWAGPGVFLAGLAWAGLEAFLAGLAWAGLGWGVWFLGRLAHMRLLPGHLTH